MKTSRKQYPPDVALAYRGEYEKEVNGETKSGTYLKVILKEDLAAGTEIIAFPRKREKKKDTDPDFGFRLSEAKKGSSKSSSSSKPAATPGLEDDMDF